MPSNLELHSVGSVSLPQEKVAGQVLLHQGNLLDGLDDGLISSLGGKVLSLPLLLSGFVLNILINSPLTHII